MFTVEEMKLLAGLTDEALLSVAAKAKALLATVEFAGTVYVDVPVAGGPWKNVHVAASFGAAVAWVRDNIGGADDFGQVGLLTLGEKKGDDDGTRGQ